MSVGHQANIHTYNCLLVTAPGLILTLSVLNLCVGESEVLRIVGVESGPWQKVRNEGLMLFFLAPVWVSLKSYFRRPVSVSETRVQVQDGLSGLLCTRKSNVRPPDSDSEERCWDRRTGSGAGCGV